MTLNNIYEEIKKAKRIVILTHETPDGDAIGSSLAMYLSLKQINKNVDVIIPEYPSTYLFLPGIEEVKKESEIESYDLAIALDCSDIKRLNGFSNYFEKAQVKISIDHHGMNTMFADYNFVNPVAPATAQILITVLQYLHIEITKEIGECIIAGIITDTGGFKYSNVTHETFEFAADLLDKGINIPKIYRKVYDLMTISRFEITKIAINRIELIENGKIAFTYITKSDIEQTNMKIGDHEGIVNIGGNLEGVEISIFIRESDNGYKVSLRSNEYVNVSDICMIFGGGGHEKASGCTIKAEFSIVKQKIINEAKRYLK